MPDANPLRGGVPLDEEDHDDELDDLDHPGFDLDDLDPKQLARVVFAQSPVASRPVANRGARRLPSPRVPGAPAEPAPARRWVQVNIRLTAAAHRDLCRAAELLELRPTQLARLLVRNGTAQALREHLPYG